MRIILAGFGNVGQSFAELLKLKESVLTGQFGLRPRIVAVIDSGGAAVNPSGLDLEELRAAKRKGSVASDPNFGFPGMGVEEVIKKVEAEVLVEATPTNIVNGEPGLSHIKAALKNKMHVITTNKGPLAIALPALMELASYYGVQLLFSGAVGGGTPILDLAKKCLAGNKIRSIKGILNGTTNYILTRMTEAHVEMDAALKEAQEAGYAEADPSYDIEGIDTACKLVIIANWIMGLKASIRDVRITGIKNVTLRDIEQAEKEGCCVKLIGSIEKGLLVQPQLIPKNHPLCVSGTLNAVTFDIEFLGEITIAGRGAGGMETANAILRDLIDVRRTLLK